MHITPAGTVNDKVKNRLEQLDDFEEVGSQCLKNIILIFFKYLVQMM